MIWFLDIYAYCLKNSYWKLYYTISELPIGLSVTTTRQKNISGYFGEFNDFSVRTRKVIFFQWTKLYKPDILFIDRPKIYIIFLFCHARPRHTTLWIMVQCSLPLNKRIKLWLYEHAFLIMNFWWKKKNILVKALSQSLCPEDNKHWPRWRVLAWQNMIHFITGTVPALLLLEKVTNKKNDISLRDHFPHLDTKIVNFPQIAVHCRKYL